MGKTRQGGARQGKAGQGGARQGKAGQGGARQGWVRRGSGAGAAVVELYCAACWSRKAGGGKKQNKIHG